LLGVATVAVGYLLLKARTLANLVFSAGQVSGISFEGLTPILSVSLIVQNTSSIGVTLQSIAGNVFTEDGGSSTLVGNLSSFLPVHIAPNQQSAININVRMRLLGIVNDIITAYQSRNYTKVLEFQCSANVDGVQMPFSFKIPVGL